MEGFCRGCLIKYDETTDLISYSEKNRRLFVYSTGLQVKRNDAFTFQLCKDCYLSMKESCKFKKACRTSDKKFKNYVALKGDGDTLDFSTYLKNNDESLMLQLPALLSGNSTPAHNKSKDDDNESTCTSIRNFMSDILQGEEVPDTEARIMKELFEEEADILDDSLDSHWLQDEDDMSIATDFRMDFNFSPFSTPRSINNDHCYTPHRINDEKYTDKPNKYHNMPLLEVDECAMDIDHVADIPMDNIPNDIYTINQGNNDLTNKSNDLFSKDKEINLGIVFEKGNSNLLMNKDINTDVYETNHEISLSENHIFFNKEKELELEISLDKDNNLLLNKNFNIMNENQAIQIEEIVEDDAIFVKDLLNIEDSTQEFIAPTEIENDFLNMANEHIKNEIDESKIKEELDYYINKVDEKRKNNENNKCSIDRNLEVALLNEQNREFSLEQLISSPRVSINSGASTPTIRNILFGDQTPKDFNLENHVNNNNIQEIIKKEDITEAIKINNIESFPLRSGLEPVSTDTNIKKLHLNVDKIDITTESNVDDIINLIKGETHENNEHLQKLDIEIKSEDIKDLIEDYVTNVYENTDNNTLDNNEIDNLLATVIPDLEDPKTPRSDTDLFKKPLPPDDQYDLENALCNICNKKFNSEIALRIHFSRIHKVKITPRKREPPTVMCHQCVKTFKGTANLIRHMKEAHSDIKEKHVCIECCMEFKSKYALLQHRRTHKEYKPKKNDRKHLCTYCGKYLNKTNHNLHQLKHQNIYKFNCELCSSKFSRKWDLERHMIKHTKKKPFKCEFCKTTYVRREMLKSHIQMHLHGYRYECDECRSRFLTKEAIIKHLTKSLCPGPVDNEKLKVTMDNIVLTPMKPIKIIDDKIIKSSDRKSMLNDLEPIITDDVQINDKKSTDDKQMKGAYKLRIRSDDEPMKKNEHVDKQKIRSDDEPMKKNKHIDKQRIRSDYEPMKKNKHTDKQRIRSDYEPMKKNKHTDKQRIRSDDEPMKENEINDEPMNKNDDKQMTTEYSMHSTDKSMKITDVTVKIEQISIDIKEENSGDSDDDGDDVSMIADSPISVTDY